MQAMNQITPRSRLSKWPSKESGKRKNWKTAVARKDANIRTSNVFIPNA